MARRTRALFRDVEEGRQSFVLFLRGFAFRARYYTGATVVHGHGRELEEGIERERLIEKLAPVPVVWIANPVDSGPLDLAKANLREVVIQADAQAGTSGPLDLTKANLKRDAMGFRVESGATWEADVSALIAAASYIIVHNPKRTPGVETEIELIEHLGRKEATFFLTVDETDDTRRALTDEAIEQIRADAKGRRLQQGTLPAALCRWVEGSRTASMEAKVRGLSRWLVRLSENRTAISADLELDACAYLLAHLVLLEQVGGIPPVLLALSQVLHSFGEEYLREGAALAEGYARFAEKLRAAWEQTPEGVPEIERTAEMMRLLEVV
jgi:hypothetical protein